MVDGSFDLNKLHTQALASSSNNNEKNVLMRVEKSDEPKTLR